MKIYKYLPIKEFFIPIACNLIMALVCLIICRIAFMLENWGRFSDINIADMAKIYQGGIRFDWATICYVNILYIVFVTIPIPLLKKDRYQQTTKVIFIITNALCWMANLMDAVYFQFIGRRCTSSVFTEFKNDNVTGVLGIEFLNHWYFIVLFILMLWGMWKFYQHPTFGNTEKLNWRDGVQAMIGLIVSTIIIIGGIRGGFDPELRPLNNKDAKEYTAKPVHSALVLNTPFSIIRTIGKRAFPNYNYYTEEELNKIYSPVHPAVKENPQHPNVVIIILESFGSEYSAYLNGKPKDTGYMPFLDSLMQESKTYEMMFSNGHSSIDGQASVHLSIPLMVESFFTSHAALNNIRGVATELKNMGYQTAYFHGADNGSLSLDGFSRSAGYDQYYGRTEYANDADWDHHWGIWDEPFLQFYAKKMSTMKQPFATTIFTLTSHHPFQIPSEYKDVYKEGKLPIYKTIQYSDMALKKFFDCAKKQPWYDNTLFVLTGDHTNMSDKKEYQTDFGTYKVPVIFYHPTDSTFCKGKIKGIGQHIDIMPTILSYTGCKRPYVAFGANLLDTAPEQTFHVGFQNDIYQIVQNGILLQFDGEKSTALYDTNKDKLLENNILNKSGYKDIQYKLERKLKAFIQSYMARMNTNNLVVKD
ncbi:MAG: LTA synthase family protein [Bacteroidaceae bacterium]|nr:LTA synthase family protein [Bacteroidaceae bacterium]